MLKTDAKGEDKIALLSFLCGRFFGNRHIKTQGNAHQPLPLTAKVVLASDQVGALNQIPNILFNIQNVS